MDENSKPHPPNFDKNLHKPANLTRATNASIIVMKKFTSKNSKAKTDRHELYKNIALHLGLSVIIFVLWHADMSGTTPFAIAFLFATLRGKNNIYVLCAVAFVASLSRGFVHSAVIENLFAVIVFVSSAYFITKHRGKLESKKILVPVAAIAFVVSQIFNVYNAFVDDNVDLRYRGIVAVIVGVVFLVTTMHLFHVAVQKRGKIPWTLDQKITLAVFVVVFALGLGGLENDYFSVHKFATILIILCGVYLFSPPNTLIIAICMGLGRSFVAMNLTFVAVYAILCTVVIAFKSRRPYYSIIALVVTDIVLGTYFNAYLFYNAFSLLPIFFGIAVFMFLPKRITEIFDISFYSLENNIVSKNIINQNRLVTSNRMANLSEVFMQMGQIYRGMISGEMTNEQTADSIAKDVYMNIVEKYPLQNADIRSIKHDIKHLAIRGVHNGEVSFLDTPPGLGINNLPVAQIVDEVNALVENITARQNRSRALDSKKIMIAELLIGMGALCSEFAKESASQVAFDMDKAEIIRDELLHANIVISDCLITKMPEQEFVVNILVPAVHSDTKAIEAVVSRVLRNDMQVDTIVAAGERGFNIITIKSAPRYSLVFGIAQIGKNFAPSNGDSYSILKLSNDKIIMAVCDGMGSGDEAKKSSVLALSLVENFYRAGFPSEVIMSSANQLLTVAGGDSFSTLDVCVFNLSRGEVDFVKVGGVDGYIKRARETDVVEAGSLPLGVLEEMKPKISKALINKGDYIILVSDGVSDSFSGDRFGLANYINNLMPESPQDLADEIMRESINRGGKRPVDDTTVLVASVV